MYMCLAQGATGCGKTGRCPRQSPIGLLCRLLEPTVLDIHRRPRYAWNGERGGQIPIRCTRLLRVELMGDAEANRGLQYRYTGLAHVLSKPRSNASWSPTSPYLGRYYSVAT